MATDVLHSDNRREGRLLTETLGGVGTFLSKRDKFFQMPKSHGIELNRYMITRITRVMMDKFTAEFASVASR